MSKNITIQEGGVGKQLTVDKLKTNLVGSGTCLWVPEDEVQLTTKSITENGTYKASDDGYYGYSQVTVNVAGGSGGEPGGPGSSVIGRDEDGDEAVVSVDDDGNIQTEKVPSSIRVITPPTNPYGIYTNGQAITTDGMVAKAYLESGGEYGAVPNGEITLNPTTAIYDSSTDTQSGEATYGGETVPFAGRVNWKDTFRRGTENEYYSDSSAYSSGYIIAPDSGSSLYAISDAPGITGGGTWHYTYKDGSMSPQAEIDWSAERTASYSVNGQIKTFYYRYCTRSYYSSTSTDSYSLALSNKTLTETAKIVLEGTREQSPAGSPQQINVSWPRPRDGKVLETTFEIRVAPGYTPNSEE